MADDDIRKYLPTAADILRRTDEEAAKKRLERALDNPDLDAAIADMRAGVKVGEGDVQRHQGLPGASTAAPVPVVAPAPVTAPVTVPAAEPEVPRPRAPPRQPGHAHARRRVSTAATIVLAVMAVATPALLVAVLKQPATTNREPTAAATTARAAATQESAPAAQSASVPAAPSAVAPAAEQTAEPTASNSAVPPAAGKPVGTKAPTAPSRDASPPSASARTPDANIPEQFF